MTCRIENFPSRFFVMIDKAVPIWAKQSGSSSLPIVLRLCLELLDSCCMGLALRFVSSWQA